MRAVILGAAALLAACASQPGSLAPGSADYRQVPVSESHFRLEYRARGSATAVTQAALRQAASLVLESGHDWFATTSHARSSHGVTSVLLDVYPARGVRPDAPNTWDTRSLVPNAR